MRQRLIACMFDVCAIVMCTIISASFYVNWHFQAKVFLQLQLATFAFKISFEFADMQYSQMRNEVLS